MNYPATGYRSHHRLCRRRTRRREFLHRNCGSAPGQADHSDGWPIPALPLVLFECEYRTRLDYDHVPLQSSHGAPGFGQVQSITYTVAKDALSFWQQHFKRHKIDHGPIEERFGQRLIRFNHPVGMTFEVLEDKEDTELAGRRRKSVSPSPCADFTGLCYPCAM